MPVRNPLSHPVRARRRRRPQLPAVRCFLRSREAVLCLLQLRPRPPRLPGLLRDDLRRYPPLPSLRRPRGPAGAGLVVNPRLPPVSALFREPGAGRQPRRRRHVRPVRRLRRDVRRSRHFRARDDGSRSASCLARGARRRIAHPRFEAGGGPLPLLSRVQDLDDQEKLRKVLGRDRRRLQGPRHLVRRGRATPDRRVRSEGRPRQDPRARDSESSNAPSRRRGTGSQASVRPRRTRCDRMLTIWSTSPVPSRASYSTSGDP